jgi:hypothetical protein
MTYRMTFFKKATKVGADDEFLGSVEVDDTGTGRDLTLVAKAFRHAPQECGVADLVVSRRVG